MQSTLLLAVKRFQFWSDWWWPCLFFSRKIIKCFLLEHLSPLGDWWCKVLGAVPAGWVSGSSTFQMFWVRSHLWYFCVHLSVLFFRGRSSNTSSFYVFLLQVVNSVMSLALCWQVVSQTLQHFRSSKTQAAYNFLYPPVYLLSYFPWLADPGQSKKPSKVDVEHCHIPAWAVHSTVHCL